MPKNCFKLTLLFIAIVCQMSYGQTVAQTLALAGKNRKAFQGVLKHFKKTGDDQKYKAALFLIENLTLKKGHRSQWFSEGNNALDFQYEHFPDFPTAENHLATLKNNQNITAKAIEQADITLLTKEKLIENINLAFKAWRENPWAAPYDFNTFCEHILPYRCLQEPLEDWRKVFYQKNMEILWEERENKEPFAILSKIMQPINDYSFVLSREDPLPALGPRQLEFRKQGTCLDFANFIIYNSRSIGLVTTFDFTPHYAASSNRHFWNTIRDTDGTHIPFDGEDFNGGFNPNRKRMAKVMRKTFSIQKNSLAYQFDAKNIPEGFLRANNQIDVTTEYLETTDVIYNYTDPIVNYGLIYVFNKGNWQPTHWSKPDEKGNANFKKMGRDVVYLMGSYVNNKNVYERFPVLVDKKGNTILLNPRAKGYIRNCRLSRDNELKRDYIDYNPFDIVTGEAYDLLIWDNGWKKIGKTQVAKDNALTYDILLKNALYLLVPINDIDGFERPFMIDPKNQQIIWY